MIPLNPKSIKIEPELSDRITKEAERLGYTYNKFIVEAVKAILEMIDGNGILIVPKLVMLALMARYHEIEPLKIGKIWPVFRGDQPPSGEASPDTPKSLGN